MDRDRNRFGHHHPTSYTGYQGADTDGSSCSLKGMTDGETARCREPHKEEAMLAWVLGIPFWTGVVVGVIVTLLLVAIF